MSYERKKHFIVNFLFYCILLAVVLFVLQFGSSFFGPFIIAFIVAFCMKHFISKVAVTIGIKRPLAAILCMALFYFVTVGLLATIGFQLVVFFRNVFWALPDFYAAELAPVAEKALKAVREYLIDIDPALESAAVEFTYQFGENLGSSVSEISMAVAGWLTGLLSKVPSALINTLVCVIASFFISADYYNITYFILKQLPQKQIVILYEVEQYARAAVIKFIKSYSLIMTVTFCELSVGFLLLGVKNPFVIAIMIAVFDVMPVLGTGGILIPWSIIAFLTGNPYMGAGIFILYLIITVVRNSIEPKIIGDQVGLHPVATLISMYLGTKMAGIVGLFGFPITLVILKQLNDNGKIKIFK